VGRLERCLNAIGVVLTTSERETTAAQASTAMPRPVSWVRVLSILSSYLTSAASNLLVVLLPALEEQLAASRHEMEEACLREFLLMEDRERAVVVGIRQGVSVALTAM
jgi:hypothetical protein